MPIFFVRGWPLPKRKIGTYPRGYLSTALDATTPEEAAAVFVTMHDTSIAARRLQGERLRVEVKDGFPGRTWKFVDDGRKGR